MLWDLITWILAIIVLSFLIFAVIFLVRVSTFLVTYVDPRRPTQPLCTYTLIYISSLVSASDLEAEMINNIDMCRRINAIVLPEYITHGLLTLVFLLTGNWFEFIINLPVVAYHLHRFLNQRHLLDETTIYQGDTLSIVKKHGMIKMGFFLFSFFLYLYRFFQSLEFLFPK